MLGVRWTSNLSEARVPPNLNPSGLNDTPATVTLASGWDVCMQNLRSKHTQALFTASPPPPHAATAAAQGAAADAAVKQEHTKNTHNRPVAGPPPPPPLVFPLATAESSYAKSRSTQSAALASACSQPATEDESILFTQTSDISTAIVSRAAI